MKHAPLLEPIKLDKAPRTDIIARIRKESPKQGVFVLELDRDYAHDFLFINDEYQRKKEDENVVLYTNEMEESNWPYIADVIKFSYVAEVGSSSIRMIDGQYRSEATFRSNTKHKFIIATGLPPETIHYMDIQKRRKIRDSLHFMRLPYPDLLASSVVLCIMFKEKNRLLTDYKYERPNHHHAVYWCKKPSNHVATLSEYINIASQKLARNRSKREHFFSVSQWAFLMYQLRYHTNEDLMMQFCTRLATGEGVDGRHIVINELRKLLRAIVKKEDKDYSNTYSRGIFTLKLHFTIRAFNLWCKSSTAISKLRLSAEEKERPTFEKIFKL